MGSPRPLRLWVAFVAGAVVLAAALDAHADAGPKFGSGLWLPVGVSLGGAFRPEPVSGFVLGGEASLVYLWMQGDLSGMWLGGVADATYDFGVEGFRHRVGPEIGYGPVGLEVTYLGLEREQEGYRPGINFRAVAGISVVSLYGGFGHLFGDGPGANFGEFGGLLKVPIPLAVESRRIGPEPAEPERPDAHASPERSEPAAPEAQAPIEQGAPLAPVAEPLPPAPEDGRWATPPEPEPPPVPEAPPPPSPGPPSP